MVFNAWDIHTKRNTHRDKKNLLAEVAFLIHTMRFDEIAFFTAYLVTILKGLSKEDSSPAFQIDISTHHF